MSSTSRMADAVRSYPRRGDLGRRVQRRREALGLSREEVAARAGMHPGYLAYVEENHAQPDINAVLRLACALTTTRGEFLGAGLDVPPGQAEGAPEAHLEHVDEPTCWTLVSGGGVGRVALSQHANRAPVVLPVNFAVDGHDIILRTGTDGPLAAAADSGAEIAVEVDHLDETFREGWSVVLVGTARRCDDWPTSESPVPWAGGQRDLVVRIAVQTVTGRRIVTR